MKNPNHVQAGWWGVAALVAAMAIAVPARSRPVSRAAVPHNR